MNFQPPEHDDPRDDDDRIQEPDHEIIYLEPLFTPQIANEVEWYEPEGRTWCQDDVWHTSDYCGISPTKYIRYDLYESKCKDLEAYIGIAIENANQKAELEALREERTEAGNLLAVIHRDGGHYTNAHGFKESIAKAVDEVLELRARVAQLESDKAERIEYPRDIFSELIRGNSPYAFYLFQWVPYQKDAARWRLKMNHDVKTFDGREAHGIWPNANSCGPFKDDEVEFIRISRTQALHEWQDPRLRQPKRANK